MDLAFLSVVPTNGVLCVPETSQSIPFLFLIAPKWIKMFVLDEADEMLSRGFKDQIYEIFQKLSTNIQVKIFLSGQVDGCRFGYRYS